MTRASQDITSSNCLYTEILFVSKFVFKLDPSGTETKIRQIIYGTFHVWSCGVCFKISGSETKISQVVHSTIHVLS